VASRLTAVDRKPQTTGGAAEQTSNTARGTLERRRTCGSPPYRDTGPGRGRCLLRYREISEPVGPSDPRRPAPPRTYRGGFGRNNPDANRAAGTAEACLHHPTRVIAGLDPAIHD